MGMPQYQLVMEMFSLKSKEYRPGRRIVTLEEITQMITLEACVTFQFDMEAPSLVEEMRSTD